MTRGGSEAAPSRVVATRVLYRVAAKGAFATPALDAEIRRAGLDARDAALASEIVYGALRVLPSLDRTIAAHLRRAGRMDAHARAALRAASYQILHLSRVPPRAAVHDAVALVRRERGAPLAGFVNAVLRRVADVRPTDPRPPDRLEVPPWLEAQLEEALGPDRAEAFLRVRPLPPPLGLRVRGDREAFARRLRADRPDAEVTAGALSPGALRVRHAGDPRRLPGYEDGAFCVQEEGAQVVALALGASEGDRVVDACAGRGGKTLLLAEAVGPVGHVTALDLHERKLEAIGAELARLHLSAERVETRTVDLTVGTGGLEARFDRVLVDAPCTNLGTVHRRPELLFRLSPEDPGRLAILQRGILRQAARLVRPGGLLAYAVCSPTREEGPGVAAFVEQELEGLERLPAPLPGSGLSPDPDGVARVGPWSDPGGGADAYQIVRWRRRGA
ncbi:MAG: RsmB/NOP family class I SAM-dependent RNA methyltransferase [Myxococcota bacterium]